METAQKRAILAILGMIESGIVQLKMLLSADGIDSHAIAPAQRPSAESGYLTDEEEESLALQQDAERKALIDFEERRAKMLWGAHEAGELDE